MREWVIIIHIMDKLPFGIDINKLLNDLRSLSWEACDILLYYSKILKDPKNKSNIIKNKNINDPVTLADLKVNELIIEGINANYKNINWEILSEENVNEVSNNYDSNSEWLWVIDPLDGTKDFIQGTGNYAVHLGLNYRQKPYIGLVLIPEKNELWLSNGYKVWCERRDRSVIKSKMSSNISFDEMTLVTSKNHQNEALKILIEKLEFKKIMVMGSIGCKISSIIRGESDIYISLSLPNKSCPKDWDFAAPEALLKTAGGAITNLYNQELAYSKPNFEQGGIIIASNNKLNHERICLRVNEMIRKYNIFPLNS